MKARHCVLLAAQLGLLAGPALAQDSGFYAFVDIGRADVERPVGDIDAIKGDDVTFDIGGGYSFGRYLSLQAAYHDFGEISGTVGCPPDLLCVADDGVTLVDESPDKISIDGYSIQVIGKYPLGELPIGLFAKVGAVAWDSDWRSNEILNESDTDLMLGGGVDWMPSDRLSVRLAYQDIDMDIRSVTLGAAFHF
jgi:OOP family OmpA-OmpF porin